ncbi:hypothetical protein COLO4_33324 [Corchorus olitorius]|uniref:DUF4216 domain-containing protein n=1 Tax=Corchorus olitorius TaxID=93759 RepID=A0A1R3GUZ0_9ROSI|nr:hypothetical protein COLO4_33324 [Corchorus olitorius]
MSVVQVGDLEGMMKWMFVNYFKRKGHTPESIDLAIDMHFAEWFRLFVLTEENGVTNQLLRTLAWGPTEKATSWPAYFVNGYKFHTVAHGRGKATMNSGICVRGSDPNDPSSNFYGYLKDIVQVEYSGSTMKMNVVLFEGDRFDPQTGMQVHPLYKLVDVNCKKLYRKYDPFVLAQQAIHVYYCEYPSMKKNMVDWMAVCETKSRRVIDETSKENDEDDAIPYQVEEIQQAFAVNIEEQIPSLFDQTVSNPKPPTYLHRGLPPIRVRREADRSLAQPRFASP